MTELVKISIANGVMEILWNRPDKKNALSNAMYRAATAALAQAVEDKSIAAVILGSTGDSFTSGNDLGDFAAAATGGEATAAGGFIEAIAQFPKPLIGAVPGLAVGVGTTMLLHCDLVFVADDAKLTTPFVNLALVPEAASSMLLPARIGYARSFAMFTLGEHLTGKQAAELGVANASMAASEVLGAARAAAAQLTKRPLGAVMATKKLMRDTETIMTQLRTEGAVFGQRLKSAEAMEAFMAFREKRAPDFSKL